MIYKMALTGSKLYLAKDPIPGHIGILLACKQSHAETTDLYYEKTVFSFEKRLAVTKWLTNIPITSFRKITKVELVDDDGILTPEYLHGSLMQMLEKQGIKMRKGVLSVKA